MRTILCIDDDERALYIRSKILERMGYRVVTAHSAGDGLKVFARDGADAIVLDYYMPDMSGAEVAWELKRRGSNVPILMLSSAVFCPQDATDVVDAFCAKIDGPANFLEVLKRMVESAEKRGGASAHTILHVDDNEPQRYAISRMLRRAGFKVLEAASGTEALEKAKELPDLVLLDVNLPDIDGFEVCRRIKADPNTAKIPVLHLTATAKAAGLDKEGAASGGEGYLVQPLPPEELVDAVHSVLSRRQRT